MPQFEYDLALTNMQELNTPSLPVPFKKYILKVKVTERKREPEIFHPLAHFPDGQNGQCWTMPKSRAGSFIQVSHMNGRDPRPSGPSSAAFSGALAWSWIRGRIAGTQWDPHGIPVL